MKNYINAALLELKENHIIKQRLDSGRNLLLLMLVAVWVISEILSYATKLIPNQTLIDMAAILFLSEYMVLSNFLNSENKLLPVYLFTFLINITLLFFIVFVSGGFRSLLVMLPVFYLLLVFIIDGIIIGVGVLIFSLLSFLLLYLSFPVASPAILLAAASLILAVVAGGYLHYAGIGKKEVVPTPQPAVALPVSIQEADPHEDMYARIIKIKETLTKKEYEIMYYILRGLSNQEIAGKLFIEETTIKFHLKNIFKKLNVAGRTDLIGLFICTATLAKTEHVLHQIQSGSDPLP